jgi:hypothetical protein
MSTNKTRTFNDVTAIVKLFLRDDYSMECIRSLRTNYPSIRIIALDDGIHSEEKDAFFASSSIEYIKTEFDIGLGAARNILSRAVKTKYILVGDDDFFYTPCCGLHNLLHLMDVADIACGRVEEDGKFKDYQCNISRQDDGTLKWTNVVPDYAFHDGIPYQKVDLAFNFYIAKTAKIRGLWDDRIKVAYEHSDFFLSAKAQGLTAVYTTFATVIHKPLHIPRVHGKYSEFRNRKSDKEWFFLKWGADAYEDASGNRDSAKSLHWKKGDMIEKERNEFQQKAERVLKDASGVMNSIDCKWWIEAGTCLGAVRDGDFIAHDTDIDLGVLYAGTPLIVEIRDKFVAAGFRQSHAFGPLDNGHEMAFVKDALKVDVFFFYPDEERKILWHSAWIREKQLHLDFPAHLFDNLTPMIFHGSDVYLPSPAEEYLTARYGDWKKINPHWSWSEDPMCLRDKKKD